MPNPGVCLPVYPTTRKGPPLKKVLSPLLASCISLTMRMNWERGHDPQVCTVVTLQQSGPTLDASPSCCPSSAARLPQTVLPPPHPHSLSSPRGLGPGGLHAVSVETQRAHLQRLSLCVVVVTSPAPSPPVSGRGLHQDCVCPLLVLPCSGCVGVGPRPEGTQCLEEVAESWELQPEAREDENRPRADVLTLHPPGPAGWMVCRQDATHRPNTQTSANISGRRERRPDPTVSNHSVVYFNQPEKFHLCNLMYICYSQPGTAHVTSLYVCVS
ncbi:unnamed protein product [Rangifer tarandus platyrhynchus]|uniref:Uncharacterized protein n=1 Tax=Rangifer tarandus platyrhynchus TaxID=3082113 RepID=A0AC59ZQF3_RANTA